MLRKRKLTPKLQVLIVAADAFGRWTALHLLERGGRVTLVDAWGPGKSHASSGGEPRTIRMAYGANQRALYEPKGGYPTVRVTCQTARDKFRAEGGKHRQLTVASGQLNKRWETSKLSDGSTLRADRYVFACGRWLGKPFPETIGNRIRPTKQEVSFFGTPAGDDRFSEVRPPVWGYRGVRLICGIPGNQERGFKPTDDTRRKEFDPTSGNGRLEWRNLRQGASTAASAFRQ